jgi:hypothetical protein
MRSRAGILDPKAERDYVGTMQQFGVSVRTELEKRQLSRAEGKAKAVVERHEVLQHVLAPAAVAAGVYVGTPFRWRVTDDFRLLVRSNVRDKYGTLELDSPLGHGGFEFRPMAAGTRDGVASDVVNFNEAMDFGRISDFSQEKYQFSFARALPLLDINSHLLYGASSNTVGGSLSRRLTENITLVVDSVHWLTPYESAKADEQKLRLRYDIHF